MPRVVFSLPQVSLFPFALLPFSPRKGVDGWMGGWVDEWMGGWVDGWMSGWVDEWMGG